MGTLKLRKEKDLLKETQSQSFDLIRKLELHVRRLNEARSEDKRQIQELARKLNNCHQEIDYLRDQLNSRNAKVEFLEEEVFSLGEELKKSNSQCEFLMQELETRETELKKSSLHITNLEESISSATLEYQCEIESMRLEMMGLEQRCFEPMNPPEGSGDLLHNLELQLDDAQKNIKKLENENKQVRDMLDASQKEVKLFCQKVQDHFKISIDDRCGDVLGSLLSKLLAARTHDADRKGMGEGMSYQLHEYQELVNQLKEELKDEKLKAKDEAEDLAQEMAELRYQMTELLEEERKRRACIEQASLQRISELEAQLRTEQRKSAGPIRYICET
uniref:Uncharacterized protein n=2 Tax=Opuntia streptacantha TaxID=393608 RepID=A0A7C9CKX1_OPUST